MNTRIFKIAIPFLAAFMTVSTAIAVSAESAPVKSQTANVSKSISGSHCKLSYTRNDNYGSSTLENRTGQSRYGSASVIARDTSFTILDFTSNSVVLTAYSASSDSDAVNASKTFSNPYYIDCTGVLYNSTLPIAGTMETLQVRIDKYGWDGPF